MLITFPVPIPKNFTETEIRDLLARQGYTRSKNAMTLWKSSRIPSVHGQKPRPHRRGTRSRAESRQRTRRRQRPQILQRSALRRMRHPLQVIPCPSPFTFNSPIGACETCRGFGRTIGIDYDLVIPDDTMTLRRGAVKPWQTESYEECQDDLMKFARKRGIPIDTPWRELTDAQREWVIEGEGAWSKKVWYGVKRFFAWLETKATRCTSACCCRAIARTPNARPARGARLKPDALLWRRRRIPDAQHPRADAAAASTRCRASSTTLKLPAPLDEADRSAAARDPHAAQVSRPTSASAI